MEGTNEYIQLGVSIYLLKSPQERLHNLRCQVRINFIYSPFFTFTFFSLNNIELFLSLLAMVVGITLVIFGGQTVNMLRH